MTDRVLALDLGGTSIRAGFAPLADPAAIEAVGSWAAPQRSEALSARVSAILSEHPGASLAGIGITVPGLVEGTVARWVPNLPYLDGVDLAQLFASTGADVVVGNDAQIAMVAEAALGAARGMEDAILLAIGTGIGSAVLSGGRVVRGNRGAACSFGWASADMNDDGDDRLGWLERHAAGRALDGLALRAGAANGAGLIEAARRGKSEAVRAIAEAGKALGTALAGAVALLAPQAILLAGGVSEAADVLAPPILASLRRHLPPHLREIEIRPGAFGSRAALVGAAVAAGNGPEWWRIRH